MTNRTALALAGLCLAACSSLDSPSSLDVTGTYHATTLTAQAGAVSVDLLAAGATFVVTLNRDHTTAGQLVVPDTQLGSGLTADLAGTWITSGSSVTFSQTADTFVRNVTWTFTGSALTFQGDVGGGVVATAVLTKQ
jgi:hypothetical protein